MIYTNQDLIDLLPLRDKEFLECGIDENATQIFANGLVHSFLTVIDRDLFNSVDKGQYEELTKEQANLKIEELRAIEKQEQEEAYKQTDAYKISILEGEQETQNEEILSNMLATTEVFEMILTMSTPMSVDIENKNKNKNLGGNSMVEVYVTLILKGAKTIDQVPAIIRDQVQAQLDLLTK
ncbi:CD1375 family protein [Romboutsia sp. 1001285H_161024_C4]|uniref:CD1375 family protein n=1 Tax=Romboutsia sp. 1001285H_161024_C4 TaxID=2787109 RepID=UPI00189C3B65|nr:CD1375 family protein [Romboutsia sp. 1001285H_161024_C4]